MEIISVLGGQGSVELLDVLGSDKFIVDAARISYKGKSKSHEEDVRLINYLLSHRHMSPFEMGSLVFKVKAPIFVTRQLQRHRTAKMNEVSARYTEVEDAFYIPSTYRGQSKSNKQASGEELSPAVSDLCRLEMENVMLFASNSYQRLLSMGLSREQARGVLPVSHMTTFVWKMDLRNLMHLIHLRIASGAQPEIREYAIAMLAFVFIYFPISAAAYEKHVFTNELMTPAVVDMFESMLKQVGERRAE